MNMYYTKKVDEIFKELGTSEKGLSEEEAQKRLKIYGLNITKKKKKINPFLIFISQFNDVFIYLLLFATFFSFLIGEKTDAIVILIILMFNALFGFIQNYKAEKAIEALEKLTETKCKVVRDGKIKIINSSEVTIGDILFLTEGDKVPADARLFKVNELKVNESILTGESIPVRKDTKIIKEKLSLGDIKNCVFSGTDIVEGSGYAVVYAIGSNTEIGKISKMIESIDKKVTPLQKRLHHLGKALTIMIIIICIIVFLSNLIVRRSYTMQDIINNLLIAISLAVAAVPEGLPAVVTISLALGVKALTKHNALIRKLPAVETLGSTSVICTDKTGTLTENKMTVKRIYYNLKDYEVTGNGYFPFGSFLYRKKEINPKELDLILRIGYLCNNATLVFENKEYKIRGDPTEGALIVAAKKAKININERRIDEIPFNSNRKMMSVIVKNKNKILLYSKGAPDIILNKSKYILINNKLVKINEKIKKKVIKKINEYALNGLRVLGFAFKPLKSYNKRDKKKIENDLIFVGLQGMIDPLREEVIEAIHICRKAGIKVKMITGDYPLTAKAIGKQLGLKGNILTGKDIENLSEKEFEKKVLKTEIFARVNPEHKLKIVEVLQKHDHVVAMTGDGVNDAPALKKADIGIAMGDSTEVAKESSDMILVDNSFANIVRSVKEGRRIYENIKKFIFFLLSTNIPEVFVIFISTILRAPYLPLTAIQILWINLVTDGPPALALGVDPARKDIMNDKPRKKSENIIDKTFFKKVLLLSSIITILTLIQFFIDIQEEGKVHAQTMTFLTIIMLELLILFYIRKEYKESFFSNKYLLIAIAISIGSTLFLIYSPLNKIFGLVPLTLLEVLGIVATLIIGIIILWIIKKVSLEFKSF